MLSFLGISISFSFGSGMLFSRDVRISSGIIRTLSVYMDYDPIIIVLSARRFSGLYQPESLYFQ
ncbi:MAG: hypothetical protein WC382_01775 [Methanoregulaceae archaeon]